MNKNTELDSVARQISETLRLDPSVNNEDEIKTRLDKVIIAFKQEFGSNIPRIVDKILTLTLNIDLDDPSDLSQNVEKIHDDLIGYLNTLESYKSLDFDTQILINSIMNVVTLMVLKLKTSKASIAEMTHSIKELVDAKIMTKTGQIHNLIDTYRDKHNIGDMSDIQPIQPKIREK